MITQFETEIVKDEANKKIYVNRDFNAPLNLVWRAWTEAELLDKWWAPKPYKAVTKTLEFKEGGRWLYHMLGPEGDKQWCRFDYETIEIKSSFSGKDAFCDENGKASDEFPGMHWENRFTDMEGITHVNVEISFQSVEVMEKIIEMGFKEGFSMGLENLDQLLTKLS
ncbi:MAG: SRPBCC domain-containing protein [Cyclobacteriaceae bacterium]|nr:SRPBCC domain-containing protein [Cyclobacteriaceae bacterium SS2]